MADDGANPPLWPPSDRLRTSLVDRIAKSLTSISFFHSHPHRHRIHYPEAAANAQRIEDAAFQAAQHQAPHGLGHLANPGDPRGASLVRIYAQQAAKMLLEVLEAAAMNGDLQPMEGIVNSGGPLPEPQKLGFDISGGRRGFLDKSLAEEMLKPLLGEVKSYSKICLSNWSFGKEAAEVAAAGIAKIKETLEDVDLSDIVAGQPEAVALQVMQVFSAALEGSKLRSVNLSDNALGEKGIRAFSSLLRSQDSLEKLFLINNGISEEAAVAVCKLLPSGKHLTTLHFHNNMSGDGGCVALSKLVASADTLEDFRFSSSRVGKDGAMALAEALGSGKSLRKIDLSDNMFGPQGGISLAETLKHHQWLTEVHLSDLALEDKGAIALLKALKSATTNLRILELRGNEITEKSAPYIACCLEENHSLEKLGLSENELEDKGVIVVATSLIGGHNNLVEVDFSANNLGKLGAVAAAQAISNKPFFKRLLLDGNHISKQGRDAVRRELLKGRTGFGVLGSLEDNEEEEDLDGEDMELKSSRLDDIDQLGEQLKRLSY